tara:strand:+ start:3925 stop:4086 length:162 start_codon:yes stop_codon:yes gene_type:complete
MKNKTTDYILGMITGIAIMIALWSCTSPLNADYNYTDRGSSKYFPLYVTIVEE